MKEHPILFSGPMIRAILANTKTQTRRVSGLDVINQDPDRYTYLGTVSGPGEAHHAFHDKKTGAQTLVRCRSGQPGDRLWVKETFQYRGASYDGHGIDDAEWFRCYGAGGAADNWDPDYPHGWYPTHNMNVKKLDAAGEQEDEGVTGWVTKRIPSIHMPRWASRITLEVTGVLVERLQDISEKDAQAEGIERTEDFFGCPCWRVYGEPDGGDVVAPDDPIGSYRSLWESINGPDSWDANPWVWAIEFNQTTPTR